MVRSKWKLERLIGLDNPAYFLLALKVNGKMRPIHIAQSMGLEASVAQNIFTSLTRMGVINSKKEGRMRIIYLSPYGIQVATKIEELIKLIRFKEIKNEPDNSAKNDTLHNNPRQEEDGLRLYSFKQRT